MEHPAQITEQQVSKLAKLNQMIQNLINIGATTRIWRGSRELINPTTGEVTGTQETRNVDLVIEDKSLFEKIDKWLKALKGTGHYVKATFAGKFELVAIACRFDSVRERFVLQFAEPNVGQTYSSNSPEFVEAIEKAFGEPAKKMVADRTAQPVGPKSENTKVANAMSNVDDLDI